MPSSYDRFNLVSDFELAGDQARAIGELVDGLERGDPHQVLLGVTGSGKTFTMAQTIARVNRPTLVMVHNKTLAAQLYQEFRRFFPGQRRRVLRQLLRLLPARSLRAGDRLVHREGSDDQRRDRSHAAVGDAVALRAPRRHHRRQRVVHLRPRLAGGVLRHAAAARARAAHRPRADPAQAGRDPVRAQRPRLRPRHVPRARRHHRGLSVVRRAGAAHRAVRRRGRRAGVVRSAHRQDAAAARQDRGLSRSRTSSRRASGRKQAVETIKEELAWYRAQARVGGQAARGAAAAPADDVRPRDDARDRLLPRHRELRAAPDRPRAGRAAADAARLPAGRRADRRRREPPDRAAGSRHVSRRPRRARKCWSRTGSACRRRSTTGR